MNLAGLLTGIGQTGSDIAQAKMNLHEQQLNDLFNKLALEQGQTNLSESSERLKRLQGEPKNEIEKVQQQLAALRAGAKAVGLTLSPEQEAQSLGILPAPKAAPLTNKTEMLRAAYMREHGGQEPPLSVVEGWEQKDRPDKAVKVDMTGAKATQVTDADGKTWLAHDPNLPAELQAIVRAKEEAALSEEERKATLEARKSAEALNRAIKLGDIRGQQKAYEDIRKVAERGINGHGFLRSVAQEVAAAEAGGGTGTKFGDMNIAEGFMQLMFGLNPKALRGSPAMLEAILKQSGGWDDRAIAEINKAINGGRLSQNVRQQIQEAATRQVEAWDQQVRQTADLSDDPKVKALMDKYNQKVVGDADAEAKGLGARQH